MVSRVRLDRADDADVIRLRGVLVEDDRIAFRRVAERDDFHRGADWGADKGFRDAVALNDLALPFRGAAAVATHRGNQKRLRAQVFEEPGDRLEDDGDVGDAAAAGG